MGFRSTRIIATEPFVNNKLITVPLQPDTCLIGLMVRIYGSCQASWASGTPKARVEGLLDSLVNRIEVTTNGQDTHKSVRPHFLAMQQFFTSGSQNERFASVGASPLANAYPTTEQGFIFGTTTQYTTVRESVYLPFEHVYCEPGFGREMTWLNLKNYNTADIKIQCANIQNILADDNAAAVTFANVDFKIEISTIEAQDVPKGALFHVWKQTMLNRTYKGAAREIAVEMPKSDSLSGLMFYVTNGDAGKLPTNDVIETFGVRRNGMTNFQKSRFTSMQALNRNEFGITAPFASGATRLDGVAFANFLTEKKINSALPSKRDYGVDALDLMLDLSALGTYTPNEAQVAMLFDEVIFAPTPKK